MKSWEGTTAEGRARKSTCCVGMSVIECIVGMSSIL